MPQQDIPEFPPEYGTIVNNLPVENEEDVYEQKIANLTEERIHLTVTREVYGKLEQQADFLGKSIEDHCLSILAESLNIQIGKPTISRPSALSGQKTGLIKGPSFATNMEYMK